MIIIKNIEKTQDGISAICKEDTRSGDWSYVKLDKNLDVVEKNGNSFDISMAIGRLIKLWENNSPIKSEEKVVWG
jgi:hypothetical protein